MKKYSFIISVLVWICSQNSAHAAVLITEVHPNPVTGQEWVELYNDGESEVDLSTWTIEDQLSTPTVAATLQQAIQPSQYLIITLASAKLNNTVDGITLKDSQGVIIDVMSYSSTEPGKSWSRASLSSPSTFTLTEPTPSTATPQPSPSPTLPSPSPSPTMSPNPSPSPTPSTQIPQPSDFTPVRLLACPHSGQKEWLEISFSGPTPLDLNGWKIVDQSGTIRNLSGIITSAEPFPLTWAGSLLNNAGDSFELLGPNSITFFASSFDNCVTGQPLYWANGTWAITSLSSSPTPTSSVSTTATTETNKPTPPPTSAPISRPTIDLQKLQLATSVHHPYATPSASIVFSDSTPPVYPFISVILGSTLLFAMSGYLAYDRLQTQHTVLAERLWDCLGLG